MSGMLLKDLYIIKSIGKSYLGVIGVFIILVLTGVYDITFFNAMFVMLLTMLPVTGFAYDEQAGWDKYAVSTPAGRVGVVRGKYLFALLVWVASVVLTCLMTWVACLVHPEKFQLGDSLLSSMLVVCVGLVLVEILLPLVFQFGAQKSRVMLMIVVGVLVAVGVVVSVMMENSAVNAPIQLVCVLLAVVALGGLVISYVTSLSMFGKKEL